MRHAAAVRDRFTLDTTRLSWRRNTASLGAALLLLSGCGGGEPTLADSGLSPADIEKIKSIRIFSNPLSFAVGTPVQLSAVADIGNGHDAIFPLKVDHFNWRSSDPSALSIDANGLATVHFDGERDVAVFASVGTKEGSKSIHISSHLLIDPDSSWMLPGQVRLLRFYVDGRLGAKAFNGAWRSSNPSVATVDTTGAVTALGPGTTTVSVALDGATHKAEISVRDVPVPLRFTQLISGNNANCGLATDGAAWCWGSGGGTNLGTTASVDRCYGIRYSMGPTWEYLLFERSACAMEPVRVQVDEPLAMLDFDDAACGTAMSGRVYCWGSTPALPGGTGPTVRALSTTLTFSRFHYPCGVTPANEAWCYGATSLRGTAAPTASGVPSRVDGGAVFKDITGGDGSFPQFSHRCALTTTGGIMCWGNNSLGELGTGDTVSSAVPRPIQSTVQFTAVIAENGRSCALSVGGGLYCWGSRKTMPTAYSPELKFVGLSPTFCAVTGQGEVYCTSFGGALTKVQLSRPLTSYAGACGIGVDGITYCMGFTNNLGQLGVGDLLSRDVLTRVAGQ